MNYKIPFWSISPYHLITWKPKSKRNTSNSISIWRGEELCNRVNFPSSCVRINKQWNLSIKRDTNRTRCELEGRWLIKPFILQNIQWMPIPDLPVPFLYNGLCCQDAMPSKRWMPRCYAKQTMDCQVQLIGSPHPGNTSTVPWRPDERVMWYYFVISIPVLLVKWD